MLQKNYNRLVMCLHIRSALIAKMENVRKNIDYKKLGYTSPNDYILKTKNVYSNYAERSAVPIELYDDILFQLKYNLYPQLF